ncbi:MAG: hypothetical protein AAGD22_17420 [Verrucomicrobiota bacterium]
MMRIVLGVVMIVLAGFCLFGYLAAGEYANVEERTPWRMGYGVAGIVFLWGALRVLMWKRG